MDQANSHRPSTPGSMDFEQTVTPAPQLTLPKGGGAIRGIGEKFDINPVTGTGSMAVPIPTSPGRSGFGPNLALSYDSGTGNGPFGFGWSLSVPSISRKTDRGLPQYQDAEGSDDFIFSGAEDLVPTFIKDSRTGEWKPEELATRTVGNDTYTIVRYRPRIEGPFSRIERWSNRGDGQDVFWRTISRDNITSWYGKSENSRISDPENAGRIFSWLICQSYDDRGNVIVYGYKSEDSTNVLEEGTGGIPGMVHEENRTSRSRTSKRYLKRVRYGNRLPYYPELKAGTAWPEPPNPPWPQQPNTPVSDGSQAWLFEVVFDYGEHDASNPKPLDSGSWIARYDPFSTYRAGFEIRTYRACQRVLMFHHFPEIAEVGSNCLVSSSDFTYSSTEEPTGIDHPVYTCLSQVAQTGYQRKPGGYSSKSLPPLEFEYSGLTVQDNVEEVDSDSLTNMPIGIDGGIYRWTDLHGEGLPGILTQQAGAWYYKRNLSPIPKKLDDGTEGVKAAFAPLEVVSQTPNAFLGTAAEILDLAGDGKPELVVLDGPNQGFYEHDDGDGWHPFRPFTSRLNRNLLDPNLKLIDLTGNGLADLLITEDDVLIWHPSFGEKGFGSSNRIPQALDERQGPRVIFADGTQSVYLADLAGDNLTDIVRIRNGEVCYWPNMGYGRFGAKITMDNSPVFDTPEKFDQGRIRLADIDGTGTTDILYLREDGVRLYFNQSGNSWSQPRILPVFPRVDDIVSIITVDLLGNGTSCLVWSSPLPGDGHRPIRYINLMGGQKPHLLIRTRNNLGAETQVDYAPSTKFYLLDKREGKPWTTRLPFPVHVVENVTSTDYIGRSRFTRRYAYHHGYFDGEEREFRGFGMIEQFDSEAFEDYVAGVNGSNGDQEVAPELFQPPVTTRTWYHTGAFLDHDRILHQHRREYYQQKSHLPEPVLPEGLSTAEFRECLRALKGLPLRQEVYSFDGSDAQEHPYTVTENNFEVRLLQPRCRHHHAVFFPVSSEGISIACERDPADPRVEHTFALEVDEFGNGRKSCSVVYGRQIAEPSLPAEVTRDQQRQYISYAEVDFTPDIGLTSVGDIYRLRAPFESKTYEVTGVSPANEDFQLVDLRSSITSAQAIDYEVIADGASPQKRILSHVRSLYLDNTLSPLLLGEWDSLGLLHKSYQLAFTSGDATTTYAGKVTNTEFTAAGYTHFPGEPGDSNWWIPSGTAIYPANHRAHFYLPIGTRDALGVETIATFDQYDLLVEKTEVVQATWGVISAINDYRVLGPVLTTDPNGNRSAVEHDELGMVTKTAVMGKAGSNDGDTLIDPTTRMEYELFNWVNNKKPNYVHTFAREQHGPSNPRWQESFAYSNGGGGVAMVKAQAHPGKALAVNPDGTRSEVDADPRWIGNGRTVLNNKGNVVKQYEPFFSTTHEYEDERTLRDIGVTSIHYYDAIGRNIRTVLPNGTFVRAEFSPWWKKTFDANDTMRQSQWYIDRGSPDPDSESEPLVDFERRSAWLAAKHADTPDVLHLDSVGRPIYAISDYGGGKKSEVRSESDLSGRFARLYDQAKREVASSYVGMTGMTVLGESAEKGKRWAFQNVLGAMVKTWDEHGRQFRIEYDALQRPASMFVQEAGQPELLVNHVVYGDRLSNAQQLNLFGTAHLIFDQAGMLRIPELDFKGNPVSVERVLARDYSAELNWNSLPAQPDVDSILTAANPLLETAEVFVASAQYDALNRPTEVSLPDGTVIQPTYNETNFLSSLRAQIGGHGSFIEFLKNQDYDAKGQRQFAHYGNDVFTRYVYDPNTFRLTNLLTHKSGEDRHSDALQDLTYTYDPVGNITRISDDAQQTHFFKNAVVRPEHLYEYDAVYQLTRAKGRELAGIGNDAIRTHTDLDFVSQLPHTNNTTAVRNYAEEYEYDLLGNITKLRHRAGVGNGWTRHYRYAFDETPGNKTNRLMTTSMPGDPDDGPYSGTYSYDPYGNMTRMPHLVAMDWNSFDQLRHVDLGGGGDAYYVYGLDGQRLRKVIERNGNLKQEWIYLGEVTIHRRRRKNSNELRFERRTVRISDNVGHIAQVDTKTRDDDNIDSANPLDSALIRYQYTNHLGSATLETDDAGNPISYEEYHPFGTTAYRSAKPGFDLSLKRYRFSGKEQDEETGLYYFGARYFAPWLARWTSSDPAGFVSGPNLYRYCANNPVMLTDPTGTQEQIAYGMKDLGIEHLTDPAEIAANLRSRGFDFTGFDAEGQELDANAEGRGDGLPKANGAGWDIGTWLRRPGEGDGEGGSGSEDEIEEVVVRGPPRTEAGVSSQAGAEIESQPEEDSGTHVPPDSLTHAGPVTERGIWQGRSFRDRGYTLEHLYNNDLLKAITAQGDNRPDYDVETDTHVKQIKSSDGNTRTLRTTASKATRSAGTAIETNPTGSMAGKRPQAVVITPTDAPASAGADIRAGYDRIRKPVANSVPPEHVRGLPGAVGSIARGLTVAGTGLSAFAMVSDLSNRDYSMAGGNAISTVAGGMELYAIASPGATIAGASAMSAGLFVGGLGLAVTSGIMGVRSYRRGDTAGAVAGAVGVLAGIAMMAGVVASSPALLVGGLLAAVGLGIFHGGRYFGWW